MRCKSQNQIVKFIKLVEGRREGGRKSIIPLKPEAFSEGLEIVFNKIRLTVQFLGGPA